MSAAAGLPKGAAALSAALRAGALSAEEATLAFLERIAEGDGAIRSFVHLDAEGALAAARLSDLRRVRGTARGALDGVALGIKDNIAVAGMPWAAGFEHYRARVAAEDAPVVRRLREAGAVILGKLNMHEGALGATNDNPWFGRCENPLRAGFTPGGSSGGSGAAVAAGFCAAALGSDTLGSVRVPAAYCGVAGFKPSFDAISTRGVTALSWTLDHVGVIAPAVEDLRLVAALAMEGGLAPPAPRALAGRRFGVPVLDAVGIEPAVAEAFAALLAQLRAAGAVAVPVTFTGLEWTRLRREGLLVSEIEGAAVHGEAVAAHPDGFSQGFRDMLAFGAKQGAVRAALAYRRLREAGALVRAGLAGVEALLLPTTPHVAFAFDTPVPANQADLTGIANIAGLPACAFALPAPTGALPASAQVMAPPGADGLLLDLAVSLSALAQA
jgi:aspartyl-tRNA(Asn)/glutamyl-tRNA(Gln) amidotransferase subunit A